MNRKASHSHALADLPLLMWGPSTHSALDFVFFFFSSRTKMRDNDRIIKQTHDKTRVHIKKVLSFSRNGHMSTSQNGHRTTVLTILSLLRGDFILSEIYRCCRIHPPLAPPDSKIGRFDPLTGLHPLFSPSACSEFCALKGLSAQNLFVGKTLLMKGKSHNMCLVSCVTHAQKIKVCSACMQIIQGWMDPELS